VDRPIWSQEYERGRLCGSERALEQGAARDPIRRAKNEEAPCPTAI
jgi:hypothetical protein